MIRDLKLLFMALLFGAAGFANAADLTIRDDAGRTVTLPASVDRVFTAGYPAEILMYTLAPDRLVGRNHPPSAAALEFVPERLRQPRVIRSLPDRDSAAHDAEFLATVPQLLLDYGNVEGDYVAANEAISRRTGVPMAIFDASLSRVPEVYRTLGKVLGIPERAELLAQESARLLERYTSAAARAAGTPRSVYYECSDDRVMPCLSNEIAGEMLAMVGARNVADTIPESGERPLTVAEVAKADPDLVIAAHDGIAKRILADASWRQVRAVREGKVYALPELPFPWNNRPPSVNRLPSVLWSWYVVREQAFDDRFFDDLGRFFELFYHVKPGREALARVVTPAR